MPPFDVIAADEQARDLQEHWRLLYVAMTRASERLVVAGISQAAEIPENSWHRQVERALSSLGAVPEPMSAGAPRRVIAAMFRCETSQPARPGAPEVRCRYPIGRGRLRQRKLVRHGLSRPRSITDGQGAVAAAERRIARAARRGTLIHQLLERLADVESSQRRAADGARWLERSAGVADAAERAEIVEQVCGILSDPRFSALFGPSRWGKRRSPRLCLMGESSPAPPTVS